MYVQPARVLFTEDIQDLTSACTFVRKVKERLKKTERKENNKKRKK